MVSAPLQPLISRLEPPVELLPQSSTSALGTDSLASNDRLSVFEEMRMFSEVPLPELSWAEGGARHWIWMPSWAK